jgi:hypothetical protein
MKFRIKRYNFAVARMSLSEIKIVSLIKINIYGTDK